MIKPCFQLDLPLFLYMKGSSSQTSPFACLQIHCEFCCSGYLCPACLCQTLLFLLTSLQHLWSFKFSPSFKAQLKLYSVWVLPPLYSSSSARIFCCLCSTDFLCDSASTRLISPESKWKLRIWWPPQCFWSSARFANQIGNSDPASYPRSSLHKFPAINYHLHKETSKQKRGLPNLVDRIP